MTVWSSDALCSYVKDILSFIPEDSMKLIKLFFFNNTYVKDILFFNPECSMKLIKLIFFNEN